MRVARCERGPLECIINKWDVMRIRRWYLSSSCCSCASSDAPPPTFFSPRFLFFYLSRASCVNVFLLLPPFNCMNFVPLLRSEKSFLYLCSRQESNLVDLSSKTRKDRVKHSLFPVEPRCHTRKSTCGPPGTNYYVTR